MVTGAEKSERIILIRLNPWYWLPKHPEEALPHEVDKKGGFRDICYSTHGPSRVIIHIPPHFVRKHQLSGHKLFKNRVQWITTWYLNILVLEVNSEIYFLAKWPPLIISTLVINLTKDTWVPREHMAPALLRNSYSMYLASEANITPYTQIETY